MPVVAPSSGQPRPISRLGRRMLIGHVGRVSTWRRTFNVDEEVDAVRRERRERRRAEWAVERAGLAYEEPAEVRAGDEQPCQLREALEAVHSPQSVGAPLLTPHGADGGGARQVARATDLLQDGREEVRVAQDVSGSGGDGGDGGRRGRARGHVPEVYVG